MQTGQNNDKLTPFKPSETPSQQNEKPTREWCIEQIGMLAVTLGEPVTPERLRLYVSDLVSDLSKDQIKTALLRARRELKFFPKIAELRELAGAKARDALQIEAHAAWESANRYLQRYGVVKYDRDIRPPLPPRIDYALRRIGGLWGLNQVTAESYPFKYKEFCEAYRLAPMAHSMAAQLGEMFSLKRLAQYAPATLTSDSQAEPERQTDIRPLKKVPAPLTDLQLRDRLEILHQQTALIIAKRRQEVNAAAV